jgi:hypothetical protein
LRDNSHFSEAADGAGGSSTLSLLESRRRAITDIATGMQGLSQLINNYPSDAGMESSIMPRIGSLLRILGEALEFTHDAANLLPTSNVGMSVLPPKLFRARRSANDRRPL